MGLFSSNKVKVWCGEENYRGNSSFAYHMMEHYDEMIPDGHGYIRREFCKVNNCYKDFPMKKIKE